MSSPPEPQSPDSKLPTMDDVPPGAPVDEQKQAVIDKGADDPKTRAEIRWEGEGGNPDPEDLTTGVFEAPELGEQPAER